MRKVNCFLCLFTILVIGLTIANVVWGKSPEGLVFFLAFDEGKGDTVKDLSGFGNNGIITGKQDWINGKFKGGFHFDGATSISVKNVKPLTELTHPMSVAAWVNPDSISGWHNIVEMDKTAADKVGSWKMGFHASSAIVWTTYGVKDFIATTPVELGKWTHVASTWDGAQAIIYVNGKPDAPIAGGGVINVKDTAQIPSLDIGWRRSSAASYLIGYVDDLFVYNRLLTPKEITDLMAGLSPLAVESHSKATTTWGALKF